MRAPFLLGRLVEEAAGKERQFRLGHPKASIKARSCNRDHPFSLRALISFSVLCKHSAAFKRALNARCAHQPSNSEMTLACGRGKRNVASW